MYLRDDADIFALADGINNLNFAQTRLASVSVY